jgi:hypothetical protein
MYFWSPGTRLSRPTRGTKRLQPHLPIRNEARTRTGSSEVGQFHLKSDQLCRSIESFLSHQQKPAICYQTRRQTIEFCGQFISRTWEQGLWISILHFAEFGGGLKLGYGV